MFQSANLKKVALANLAPYNIIVGGTEIWEMVRQVRKVTVGSRVAHAPQLLDCYAQRVWSRFITLCRGGAHYATKKCPGVAHG